jgi:uncharacterized protein YecE (DUF72 family)
MNRMSIHLGTQGWSYKSWDGVFYPQGTPPGSYLAYYATQFRAIEIDSSFYGTPRKAFLEKWDRDTPADFRFAAKFPKLITHEKMLVDAQQDAQYFLSGMSLLGEKLGPLCLQFSYEFKPESRNLLDEFLAALPTEFRYAVEVRNRGWFKDWFFELLKKHRAALVLVDRVYMPKLEEVTTDFTYIRWLGNRKDVPDDEYTHVRINRDKELNEWADVIQQLHERDVDVWGFANNHYMGHSPATLREIQARLQKRGIEVRSK